MKGKGEEVKFWELVSVCSSSKHRNILASELSNIADKRFHSWLLDFDNLVKSQERSKLDAEVPLDVCNLVFGKFDETYVQVDGTIRKQQSNIPFDRSKAKFLSISDIFSKFGGKAICEIEEYGSYKLPM